MYFTCKYVGAFAVKKNDTGNNNSISDPDLCFVKNWMRIYR
jgi:hypothetical protein